MRRYTISELAAILETENIDNINIFCQFFIHSDVKRFSEIKKCLEYNVKNKYITKIYLLNEKIYTDDDIGIKSDKIVQYDIGRRLKFKDVFEYILTNNIKGYNIMINSDIFFDETLKNLYRSDIHVNKKMFAQLRYEYDEKDYTKSKIFGERGDSQDSWIIHSNFNVEKSQTRIFNFEFGKPGCDNKLTYLFSLLGYQVINDPQFIRTIHVHNTNIRNYSSSETIKDPYEIVIPKYYFKGFQQFAYKYNDVKSNVFLKNYLEQNIKENKNFIIPRVAGIENDFAICAMLQNIGSSNKDVDNYLLTQTVRMKNNAGINLTCKESIKKYSELYLSAFNNCEIYANWSPFDAVYNSIKFSHEIIDNMFSIKQTVYACVFDIYHFIYSQPWTTALAGKRILIISAFADSINEKIPIRKEIYGIDLFPDCEILTIKPPQTQGKEPSEDFEIEFNMFTKKLEEISDKYDVALVSCGGYGNLVCDYIYKKGKSAIYVGGVLQMYWGILGTRWFNDRADVIRLFLNKSWSRPKDTEKPSNHNNIEGSCYW
jgi:hypothetical protein